MELRDGNPVVVLTSHTTTSSETVTSISNGTEVVPESWDSLVRRLYESPSVYGGLTLSSTSPTYPSTSNPTYGIPYRTYPGIASAASLLYASHPHKLTGKPLKEWAKKFLAEQGYDPKP